MLLSKGLAKMAISEKAGAARRFIVGDMVNLELQFPVGPADREQAQILLRH